MTEQQQTMPESRTLPIGDIQPYWRNPRRIPQEAVDAVAESIQTFGYHQPIVVDSQHVVIVGHTRLAALKQLGTTDVEVYVSDLPEEKAKEYRLVDNRTQEMSSWDHDALVMELREFETDLLQRFFPDIDLEIGQAASLAEVTEADVEDASEKVKQVKEAADLTTTEVVCPSCYHSFQVRTDSLPGLTYNDLEELHSQQYGEAEPDGE